MYYVHTIPLRDPVNLGKAVEGLLECELATSAAWPSEDVIRIAPSLAQVDRGAATLRDLVALQGSITGWNSLLRAAMRRPRFAWRALRSALRRKGRAGDGEEEDGSVEGDLEEIHHILREAQKFSLLERQLERQILGGRDRNEDRFVRLFLRPSFHTLEIGDAPTSLLLEPRVLIHRDGAVQITFGIHLPAGLGTADILEAASPDERILATSSFPEPYAKPGQEWTGGKWAAEREAGVRMRLFDDGPPASVHEWLKVMSGRVLSVIGARQEGNFLTSPIIIAQTGECCREWEAHHTRDIAHLCVRHVPEPGAELKVSTGPDLSVDTSHRVFTGVGSALILKLRPWRPSINDLRFTLLIEHTLLTFLRLRRLERSLGDMRTARNAVEETYQQTLHLTEEARGSSILSGSARDIARNLLVQLGAPETLENIRLGITMLGERAGTRATVHRGRVANRLALFGVVVALVATVPSIPSILELIERQRTLNPDATVWTIITAVTSSPWNLAAVVLGAAVAYVLGFIAVAAVNTTRYLLAERKRGYASTIGDFDVFVDDETPRSGDGEAI